MESLVSWGFSCLDFNEPSQRKTVSSRTLDHCNSHPFEMISARGIFPSSGLLRAHTSAARTEHNGVSGCEVATVALFVLDVRKSDKDVRGPSQNRPIGGPYIFVFGQK